METTKLAENPKYILECLSKNKISSPYNEITDIVAVNNLTDYEFKGVKFKLIQYRAILRNKKQIKFYGYVTSKRTRKLTQRWIFLNYLYNHNFSVSPFLVPKPLIFFPKFNLFLRAEAKGKTVFAYIKKNKIQELEEAAPQIAGWLRKLHNVKIENKKIFMRTSKIEEKEFKHYLKVAEKFFRVEVYQKTKKNLTSIQRHTKLYLANRKDICLIHGDFQPTNVIYNKRNKNVTVIDFDWSGIGDPLSDVGNFLIQFDYHSAPVLKEKDIIKLKKKFLNNYLKNKALKDFAARINLYQAKFAIQRAVFNTEFTLPRSCKPEKNPTISLLLKKAEECLLDRKNINLKVYQYKS